MLGMTTQKPRKMSPTEGYSLCRARIVAIMPAAEPSHHFYFKLIAEFPF